MNKRLTSEKNAKLFCIVIIIALTFVSSVSARDSLEQKAHIFRKLISEKKSQGVDVAEALKSGRLSREAFDKGDRKTAADLLDDAIARLGGGADVLKENESYARRFQQLLKREAKIIPDTYFIVHCEPGTVGMFNDLKRFIELAERYNAKLTIEFTPPWAEMILADKNKLTLLRQWQKNGHEVAAHHHGLWHIGTWDGYTDRFGPDEVPEQRVDVRGNIHKTEKYLGTMRDYMKLMNGLAAPEPLVTGCTLGRHSKSPEAWADGLIYETEGGGAGDKDKKPSPPTPMEYNGRKGYSLPMFAIMEYDKEELIDLCEKYLSVNESDVAGIVTHTFNFARSSDIYEDWFRFLQSKDPEGRHNKSVFQLMKERGL